MSDTSFETHQRLIKSLAYRVLRRCHAAGAAIVSLEDVMQELMVAWVKARDLYNPDSGVPFSAYLYRGMINHVNRWVSHEIGASLGHVSVDAPSANGSLIGEAIEDERVTVEQDEVRRNMREKALAALSPAARQFYLLLENPPQELVAINKAAQERARFARARGIVTNAPSRISASQIFDLMGVNNANRTKIVNEINSVAGKISQ